MTETEHQKCVATWSGNNPETLPKTRLVMLPLDKLKPHPGNPPLKILDDVIEGITEQLPRLKSYPKEHAILLRLVNGHCETLGAQRFAAALQQVWGKLPAAERRSLTSKLILLSSPQISKGIRVVVSKFAGTRSRRSASKNQGASQYQDLPKRFLRANRRIPT